MKQLRRMSFYTPAQRRKTNMSMSQIKDYYNSGGGLEEIAIACEVPIVLQDLIRDNEYGHKLYYDQPGNGLYKRGI